MSSRPRPLSLRLCPDPPLIVYVVSVPVLTDCHNHCHLLPYRIHHHPFIAVFPTSRELAGSASVFFISPAHTSNNVEATFDLVEKTTFYDKLVRRCCHFWQQSRLVECCFDIVAGVDGALHLFRNRTLWISGTGFTCRPTNDVKVGLLEETPTGGLALVYLPFIHILLITGV